MKSITLLAGALLVSIGFGTLIAMGGDESRRPITQELLDDPSVGNVLEAVQQFRPSWLEHSGVDLDPKVFIEIGCEDISCLRWLDSHHVESARFIDEGTAEWSPRPMETGAIVVRLREGSTVQTPSGDRK